MPPGYGAEWLPLGLPPVQRLPGSIAQRWSACFQFQEMRSQLKQTTRRRLVYGFMRATFAHVAYVFVQIPCPQVVVASTLNLCLNAA